MDIKWWNNALDLMLRCINKACRQLALLRLNFYRYHIYIYCERALPYSTTLIRLFMVICFILSFLLRRSNCK